MNNVVNTACTILVGNANMCAMAMVPDIYSHMRKKQLCLSLDMFYKPPADQSSEYMQSRTLTQVTWKANKAATVHDSLYNIYVSFCTVCFQRTILEYGLLSVTHVDQHSFEITVQLILFNAMWR